MFHKYFHNSMSKLLLLCCTLAVFVVMGCSKDENPVDGGGNQTFTISDFVPNGVAGTVYDMKMTIVSTVTLPGQPKQEQTFDGIARFTILERDVTTPDGKYKGIKGLNYSSALDKEIIDTIYYAATAEGVLIYQSVVEYEPVFMIKAPIQVGTQWTGVEMNATSNIKIASINDQVQVKTGSYKAIKLTNSVSSSDQIARSQTSWITKEVGFVKSIAEAKFEQGSVSSVTVTTTELVKITKP